MMMVKFKKFFFLFFIALIAIAAIAVYQTWNKRHRDIRSAKAVLVPATELYNNLANGSGNTDYINQIVAVSGRIKEMPERGEAQEFFTKNGNISFLP